MNWANKIVSTSFAFFSQNIKNVCIKMYGTVSNFNMSYIVFEKLLNVFEFKS